MEGGPASAAHARWNAQAVMNHEEMESRPNGQVYVYSASHMASRGTLLAIANVSLTGGSSFFRMIHVYWHTKEKGSPTMSPTPLVACSSSTTRPG